MKSCFIVCCLFFLGVISSVFLLLYMLVGGREDSVVANSLPKYPNTTSYEIRANSGLPDGSSSAHIDLTTHDSPEQIINFYKTELVKRGWQDMGPEIDPLGYVIYEDPSNIFTKVIGGKLFRVSMSFSTNGGLIFVSHNIRNYGN